MSEQPPELAAVVDVVPTNGHVPSPTAPARVAPPATVKKHTEGGLVDFRDHPACAPFEIMDARGGQVRDPRNRQKLGIVGFSASTRDEAPFDDPTWALAGLNQLNRYIPRADLWFEMHNRDLFVDDTVRGTDYVTDWLQQTPLPVLMEPDDYDAGLFTDIPTAVRFPIEATNALAGAIFRPREGGGEDVQTLDYWESSVAYMLQWAILVGYKEIGIWGVDMIVGEEYGYQKPNLEFYLGLAMGLGIKLVLPKKCALLKQMPRRYGRRAPTSGPFTLPFFDAILTNAEVKRNELITNLNHVEGAEQVIKNLRDAAIVYGRGGVLKDFGIIANYVKDPDA